MKKLAIGTAAAALALAMTSCGGGFSSDGRLFIKNPTVITEYRISGAPNSYVGCDRVNGIDATTTVKAELDSSGYLKQLNIQLKGQTNSTEDGNFKASFTRAANDFSEDNKNHIIVKFTADAAAGVLLPTSKAGAFSSQSIIVTPAKPSIKEVNVLPSDKINKGFKVAVQGISDQDNATDILLSDTTIAVYTNCTVVKTTDETL